MDNYTRARNTGNSYAERAIYDEIIANLDSFVLSSCEIEENEQKIKVERLDMWGNTEDSRLNSIMNDHNYILRSKSPHISYCVRENLIDFVKKNSSSSSLRSSEETIGKMIDSVMRLLSNATDYDTVIDKLDDACDPHPKEIPKIEAADDQSLNECRNQSEEENTQQKDEQLNIKLEVNLSPVKEPENVVNIKNEIECDTKPPLVLISESAVSADNSTVVESNRDESNVKVSEKSPANLEESTKENQTNTENIDKTDHNENAHTSQPDNSLKEHPVSTGEDATTENPPEKPTVITELLKFAEKLKEDCTAITSKKDFDLDSFLATNLKEYKSIINSANKQQYTDTSVQTVKVISKKKLRKINAKDKRLLLQSSNDSDSSNSSYIGKNLTEIDTEFSSKKPVDLDKKSCGKKDALDHVKSPTLFADSDFEDECMKSDSSDTDESDTSSSKSESDDSDDADSSSSSEKEKDKSKCLNANSKDNHDKEKDPEKGTNESDKENRSLVESPETSVVEKSKEDGKVDEDNQDKQIERLLNLKGLTEPQKNTSLPNNSKPSKLASKSKTDRLFAVMQEADKNSSNEDSGHEEGEPVLTEKQFLFKCNENLKQQLLNSASSDSENFNTDEDADIINKINDLSDDEDEKHLSNVDKFLETLVDTEENSPATNELPKPSSPTKSLDTSTDKNSSVIELDDTDPTETSKTDQETMGFKKKEVPQKSFETLLSNEKRQKPKPPEELIDLSGDSSNSDVEEFPVESKEKSQRIKPMLRQDQLESETIYSQKKETERLRRLEKKNTYLTKMLKYSKDSINESDLVLDYATANKKFIKVHPDIVKHLKPHQRDGVKFMYDSCYGCVDHLKDNSGSGCILAHCMGLGKTLQIIALLHTVTTYKELKTSKILVLCPKSTIMNWADEIQRWLGPLDKKTIQIFNFSDTADVFEKINVLRQWSSSTGKAGCMIMGYEAFRSLVFYNSNKNRMKSAKRIEDIRASINKYLLKPGADLVVCDEGHIIKNRKSGISLAAAKIITPKRIVLTGTPIQNNLKEYYSMVNFIKPLILGTEKEFANLYANPIKNGQHKDSSKRDIKVMKQRSFVLHKKLSKFVQRKEAELLQSFLPQKFEYVLFIPMSDVQNNLYEYVLDAISKREDSRGRSLITDYTCLRKIWTHPKVLEDAWKNAITARNKKEPRKQTTALGHSDDDQPDDIYDNQTGVISVQRDWWRSMLTETDLESILPSNKLKTMFEIIRMSEENGEKCLIFSAFVAVLNVVEFFLNKTNDNKRNYFMFDGPDKPTAHWVNGQDYYRLDGKTNKTLRHEMIKRFNDPKNKRARLFLISARAGGQGINLIGANRVIILDTSWNPANDQQNIFRIFRLGQKRNCYVYRLIAMGTMEEKVYSRSVTKQAMSFRVVDEQQIDRHYSMAELAELYTLTKPDYSERPVPVFPQDQILANLLLNFPDLVYKYHEHDSLLENKVEQELSEQEKADAWVAYERDLQMNSEPREVTEGYHGGHPLFAQGNYMYPMGDFDPNALLPSFDPTQMDMAARNPLGAFPNYLVNRTSYLDIINMYKKFSTTLMNDKNNRNARYNPNYANLLASGMMNSAMCNVMPPTDSHLSALANPLNPYYPLHSLANPKNPFANPLNSNPMLSNPNLAALGQVNNERYERNKNIISVDDPIPPSLCNYNLPLPPYPKDLSDRSLQPKNLMQNPPPASSASPTRQQSQNVFNPNLSKEIPGIPRSIIQKKRGKPPATSSPLRHSNSPLDPASKSRAADSLLRTPSPAQNMSISDPISKMFDPSAVPGPVNMGIVYPKPVTVPSPSRGENNEGGCLLNSGSSMQIIPTHTQLAESVRKKFDNISPNISLTAVRTIPKPLQHEQVQSPLNSSHMEVIPSNVRKRRGSLSSPLIPESDRDKMFNAKANPLSAIDQPSYPPKVTKF